jgi:hypothetical protein
MTPMLSLLATALAVSLQAATPAQAVDAYAEAIARGSPAAMGQAFQPSAIMYCTDGRSVTATSQAQWKARLAQAAPPSPATTTTEWLDAGASSALVRLRAVRGAKTYVDYLLLARLGTGWRIVGKLCQADAQDVPASRTAVDATIDRKLASDRSWDDALLAASIDPRALVMTVEDGELVAASLPEWQARYRDRRSASRGNVFDVTSRVIDARGDIGVARWSFRSATGEYTDRALVMKTAEGWRIMALMFAREKP